MVVAYCLFLVVRIHADEGAVTSRIDDPDLSSTGAAGWIVVGFGLVAVGGHLLVASSEAVAVSVGVPAYMLGLVTGFGTTIPEVTIAAFAVHRDEADIAVGTLLGSNVTDPLFSLGLGALVGGLAIDHVGATVASASYMLVAAALVALVFFVTGGISRRAAVGCIVLYLPTFVV
jgi:cation:H+ antiporter